MCKMMMGSSVTRGNLRSMVNRLRGGISHVNNYTFASSTTQKMQAYAPSSSANLGDFQVQRSSSKEGRGVLKGDFVPVYVALGMIVTSVTIGFHTAVHELMYSPEVHLRKSRRETLPEVDDPDTVVDEGDKFIKKSWFRKMAHIQYLELVPRPSPTSTPSHEDPLTRPPRAETLKSVGIDPKSR